MSTVDPGGGLTPLALEPEAAAGRRRGLQLGVGIVLAALVVAAGAFALARLRASDGGGDTPEDAVAALFDAIEAEDLVGLADVLLPGERRALADPLLEIVEELRRLEVLAADFDASAVGGFDLVVEGLELTTDQVADDLANVYASGTIVATIDGSQVPVGRRVDDFEGVRDELGATHETESSAFSQFRITTVREDGRWYVSLFHSLGEALRLEEGRPVVTASEALVPRGAASPDAALDALLDAAERLDARAALELLDPDEAAALHRYAPQFLDEAAAAAEASAVAYSIEVLDSRIEQDGDRARIFIESYRMTITTDDPMYGPERITLSYEDGCSRTRVESEYDDDVEYYPPGPGPFGGHVEPDGTIVVCDDEIVGMSLLLGAPQFTQLGGASGLVFTRHDGAWYLSPIRTFTESVLTTLRGFDDERLAELEEWWMRMADPYAYAYSYGEDSYGEGWAEGGSVTMDTVPLPMASTTVVP